MDTTMSNRTEDLRNWLALSFVPDIGPVTGRKLLSVFRSPSYIMNASSRELRSVGGIKEARAKAIRGFDDWALVDAELEKLAELDVRIITCIDKEYPEALRQIEDAPLLLYIKGEMLPSDSYSVGIVGSRDMSPYGKKIAESFSEELAARGITIVSGMARGIDSTAHKGALRAGGRSIAVLGCGIDTVYPRENEKLLAELAASGAVLSEFRLGTPPARENFPKRNRLISALSLGVLIVEAAAGSGSLITATYALEQGKDIFAVPGGITAANSVGTNELIKKGAKLVQAVDDILQELSPLLRGMLNSEKAGQRGAAMVQNLAGLEINNEEKAICTVLGCEPRHIDTISRETGLSTQRLLAVLLDLELRGIVRQDEGKRFYIL